MALDLFKRVETRKGLFAVEKITLIYNLLTSILILFLFQEMDHPVQMLADRAVIAGMTFFADVSLPACALQVFRLHPHRYPDVVALLLVSRHIRVQPYLPQPGPCFRFGRAMDIRRTACRMVLSAFSADVGE